MRHEIITIRGSGNLKPLVWPAALDERIEASHSVRQAWTAANGRPARQIGLQHEGIQRAAARLFFEAQGWKLRASRSHPSSLFGHRLYGRGLDTPDIDALTLIRHAHFAFEHGNIAAAVVHLYGAHDLAKLPADIAIDLLPESWYNVRRTVAACLRPDPGLLQHDGTLRARLSADDVRRLTYHITNPAPALAADWLA